MHSLLSIPVRDISLGFRGGVGVGLGRPSSVPVSAERVLTVGGALPLRTPHAAVRLRLRVCGQGQLFNKKKTASLNSGPGCVPTQRRMGCTSVRTWGRDSDRRVDPPQRLCADRYGGASQSCLGQIRQNSEEKSGRNNRQSGHI